MTYFIGLPADEYDSSDDEMKRVMRSNDTEIYDPLGSLTGIKISPSKLSPIKSESQITPEETSTKDPDLSFLSFFQLDSEKNKNETESKDNVKNENKVLIIEKNDKKRTEVVEVNTKPISKPIDIVAKPKEKNKKEAINESNIRSGNKVDVEKNRTNVDTEVYKLEAKLKPLSKLADIVPKPKDKSESVDLNNEINTSEIGSLNNSINIDSGGIHNARNENPSFSDNSDKISSDLKHDKENTIDSTPISPNDGVANIESDSSRETETESTNSNHENESESGGSKLSVKTDIDDETRSEMRIEIDSVSEASYRSSVSDFEKTHVQKPKWHPPWQLKQVHFSHKKYINTLCT